MPIAVSHPGKIGDLLFAMPTVQYLSARHGCAVDVYTSPYCRDAVDLIECQPYVRTAEVLEQYVMEHFDVGVQPWHMPVPEDRGYDAIYHLGFRDFPDRHCIGYTAKQVGLPEPDADTFHLVTRHTDVGDRLALKKPYVVVTTASSTSGGSLTWSWSNEKISDWVRVCPYPVYAVGLVEEMRRYRCYGAFVDLPGLSLPEVAEVMQGSAAVITFSTGLGVLASGVLNGTGVPLVCMFDGELSWEVFRLPGCTTCSPDQDLSDIAFRRRSAEQLEQAVAALERDRRALQKAIKERTEVLEHALLARDVDVAELHVRLDAVQRRLAGIERWTAPFRAVRRVVSGR